MFVPDSSTAYKVYEQKNAIQKDHTLGSYFIDENKYNELSGFKVEPWDIIVSCAGTIGETYVMPKDIRVGIINQALMLIRLHLKDIQDFYLLYFDFILKAEAAKESKGTAIKNIPPFDVLKSFLIPIPPLAEQGRILNEVNRLMSFVDSIDVNTEDITSLIYKSKSKILDLAIHGKLVPQDANDEPASELLKRINPKAVVSCDNPHYAVPYKLPHGWKWVELGKLAIDSADGPFGSNLKKEHYTTNKEVRIIQLSNIGDDGWRDENTKYTTFEHLSAISRSEVKSGDVVIAKMMPAGRAILCPDSDLKYVLSSDAVKFVLPEGICNEYILNSINSSVFKEQVYDNVQGVTRVRTSLQKLRTYVLPIPPYKEQIRIVSKVNELFSQLNMIEKSLQA